MAIVLFWRMANVEIVVLKWQKCHESLKVHLDCSLRQFSKCLCHCACHCLFVGLIGHVMSCHVMSLWSNVSGHNLLLFVVEVYKMFSINSLNVFLFNILLTYYWISYIWSTICRLEKKSQKHDIPKRGGGGRSPTWENSHIFPFFFWTTSL